MGLGKFIKKCVFTAGFLAAAAYAGDSVNFNDRVVYPLTLDKRQVETGFYEPLKVQRKIVVNERGNLETYLISNDIEIPVLRGTQGPILDPNYELRNLDQSQRYSLVVEAWDGLSPEQRYALTKNEVQRVLGERRQGFESAVNDLFGGD